MSNPDSKVTLKDIAKAMNLSNASISMALRGSPKIPEARQKQIREKAKEMGYIPNPAATALSRHRTTSCLLPPQATIAWLNLWEKPDELRMLSEYDNYWKGASAAAAQLGYRLEEFRAFDIPPYRLCQILRARGIHGILLPPHIQQPNWTGFEWQHFSIIRLGRSLPEPQCHVVTANQVASMVIAFEQTVSKGYKRIGLITSLPDPQAAFFDAGYLRAQRATPNLTQLPICSIPESSDDTTSELIKRWIQENQPDAILTNVQRVPKLLKDAGFRIPDHFAFASLSTLDIESNSGIYQNPLIIGEVAIHRVISLMTTNVRGIPEAPNELQVAGKWIDGSDMPEK